MSGLGLILIYSLSFKIIDRHPPGQENRARNIRAIQALAKDDSRMKVPSQDILDQSMQLACIVPGSCKGSQVFAIGAARSFTVRLPQQSNSQSSIAVLLPGFNFEV